MFAEVESDAGPVTSIQSEEVLLARALAAGDWDAAPRAWHRFNPLVQRTLRRILGRGADFQDLTQEVFFRFFRKIRELKKLESLRSFLIAIAIRRAKEEIKRQRVRRVNAPFLPETILGSTTMELDPEAREVALHLFETLGRLSDRDRTIYLLRHIRGLDLGRISVAVGLSMSTLRRRIERLDKRMTSLIKSDPVLSEYVADRVRLQPRGQNR
jgi:RNA polymerase sigma-70 factor, ECF subfamily